MTFKFVTLDVSGAVVIPFLAQSPHLYAFVTLDVSGAVVQAEPAGTSVTRITDPPTDVAAPAYIT